MEPYDYAVLAKELDTIELEVLKSRRKIFKNSYKYMILISALMFGTGIAGASNYYQEPSGQEGFLFIYGFIMGSIFLWNVFRAKKKLKKIEAEIVTYKISDGKI